MTIICEVCGALFTATLIERPDGHGGAVGQFACPNCPTRYEAYTIDAEGITLRAKVQAAKAGTRRTRLLKRLKEHVKRGRGATA